MCFYTLLIIFNVIKEDIKSTKICHKINHKIFSSKFHLHLHIYIHPERTKVFFLRQLHFLCIIRIFSVLCLEIFVNICMKKYEQEHTFRCIFFYGIINAFYTQLNDVKACTYNMLESVLFMVYKVLQQLYRYFAF